MKIKIDYVTNSSSTSYIMICGQKFSVKDLSDLMGIGRGSPLFPLVESLHEVLERTREPARRAREIVDIYEGDFQAFVRDRFSDRVWLKVVEAEKHGKQVHVGHLSSEETAAESLFCGNSFEAENSRVYLNALNCTW